MKINYFSSKEEVLAEIGRRLKAARIAKSFTQKELAETVNLSLRTISNIETGKDVSFGTIIEVMRALDQLQNLETAIPEQIIRPSQIAQLGKPRERVTHKKADVVRETPGWKWGDEE